MAEVDILVLGATGLTGTLISKHLFSHPERSTFRLGLGGRSLSKLEVLHQKLRSEAEDHKLKEPVSLVNVDVTDGESLVRAVRGVRVVINTCGPYWRSGTAVVQVCVKHGVHYVDLAGEPAWVKHLIDKLDLHSAAKATKSIIINSVGGNSVISDLTVYISAKKLREQNEHLGIDISKTGFEIKTNISRGTLGIQGQQTKRHRMIFRAPVPSKNSATLIGGSTPNADTNVPFVQRSFGLFQQHSEIHRQGIQYGKAFKYEEFNLVPNTLAAIILSVGSMVLVKLLQISAVRTLVLKLLPNGIGSFDEEGLEKGYIVATNITSSDPSSSSQAVMVKSTIRGKGDPGYLLTSMMISEAALALLPSNMTRLTDLAKEGGILTPATALGDVLIERLTRNTGGRIMVESEVIRVQ